MTQFDSLNDRLYYLVQKPAMTSTNQASTRNTILAIRSAYLTDEFSRTVIPYLAITEQLWYEMENL